LAALVIERAGKTSAAADGGLTAVVVEPFAARKARGCAGAIVERAGRTKLARERTWRVGAIQETTWETASENINRIADF
jgi:hypothetical protein